MCGDPYVTTRGPATCDRQTPSNARNAKQVAREERMLARSRLSKPERLMVMGDGSVGNRPAAFTQQ